MKYQEVLEGLERFECFLEKWKNDLYDLYGSYHKWVENMESEGIEARIANKYKTDYHPANEDSINKVIYKIEDHDLPFIRSHIATLEDILQKLS